MAPLSGERGDIVRVTRAEGISPQKQAEWWLGTGEVRGRDKYNSGSVEAWITKSTAGQGGAGSLQNAHEKNAVLNTGEQWCCVRWARRIRKLHHIVQVRTIYWV